MDIKGNSSVSRRIDWIDYGKGICMILVMLYHTQIYYAKDFRSSDVYTPIFLTLFFFISGFLSFSTKPLNVKIWIYSIIRGLIFPYLIFTTLIWIPKALSHGNDISLMSYLVDIFGGYASWFVAALVVAKLLFLAIRMLFNAIILVWISSLMLMILGVYLTHVFNTPSPWYTFSAMISLFYIVSGYTVSKYENIFKYLTEKRMFIISFCMYLVLFSLNYFCLGLYKNILPESSCVLPMNFITYLGLSILGIIVIINIICRLPSDLTILKQIGKNSLVYYFLNGGVITVICMLVKKTNIFIYQGHFYQTLIVLFVVIGILYFVSTIIAKYFPIIIGDKNAINKLFKRK